VTRKPNLRSVTVYFDKPDWPLLDQVSAAASAADRSVSAWIRALLREHFDSSSRAAMRTAQRVVEKMPEDLSDRAIMAALRKGEVPPSVTSLNGASVRKKNR
jgi:hypothetical protein